MSVEAQEYKLTLSELTSNNKTQINLLTILADDYKHAASHIVDTIEAHLHTVAPSQKLLILYVCDSILKNVKGVYIEIFSKKIIPMFLHVFQNGDEKVRASLYKLRVTWSVSEIFVPSKMYQLDMKVNALDGAWPIANPRTGRALKDDPDVKPPKVQAAGPTAGAKSSNSQSKVFVNRKFIHDPKAVQNTVDKKPPGKQQQTMPKVFSNPPKKENRAVDPLDKLLPSASKSSTTSSPPNATKRKASNNTSSQGDQQTKRRTIEMDKDLRPKDQDLRQQQPAQIQKPVIKPTLVAGSHAFSAPPPAATASIPLPKVQIAPIPAPMKTPPVIAQVLPLSPSSTPTTSSSKAAIITNEAVKLDIPQNNRIFVDGKAYEVMFIDDVAVIERAGAPHRIYFAGAPRNVLVDGVPHMLKFGETKNVDIGGSLHAIRFGAPSRELYIGGHPFKGQFGGSPIVCTINGVRHDIRLTGSAPEVKIEPDPAYDLSRFLCKMREGKKSEMKQEKPKPVDDPFNLLKKLQRSGYLKPSTMPAPQVPPQPIASRGNIEVESRVNKMQTRIPPSSSAPSLNSPSLISVGVEKRPQAPSLKEFNLRLLKVRYDDVVATLLRKREDCCKYCGMKLDTMPVNSKEWAEHMDWHVKRNLSKQESNQYRKWYPTSLIWLTIKSNDHAIVREHESEEEQQSEVVGVISTGAKECAICREKFDEIYDHDEEAWRFKDSIYVNDKIVHVSCSSDASLLETPTKDTTTSPFFIKSEDLTNFGNVKEEVMDYEDQTNVKQIIQSDSSQIETKPLLNTLIGR